MLTSYSRAIPRSVSIPPAHLTRRTPLKPFRTLAETHTPDGSRFMAGFSLFETATLNVLAQENTASAPFPLSGSFATQQNVGGSAFSPDGTVVFGAFNTQPLTTPPSRPTASTLLIEDPQNLGIKIGIKLPESIVAKMVISSDGTNAWGMSESGLLYLPLSTLYDYPILMPDSTNVFLAQDDCNRGIARTIIKVNNVGKGKLTFAVPSAISGGSAAIIVQASSGLAPDAVVGPERARAFSETAAPWPAA